MKSLVCTDMLGHRYAGVDVLTDVSFRLEHGELCWLVGSNGSGKSTLLRILAGLTTALSGTAYIDGHAPGSLRARRVVSYLGDDPVFYDDLTLYEHLEFVARLHSVDDWVTAATDLADQLSLRDRLDQFPRSFSKGYRQRAALAIALIRPRSLLLLDEPFSGLDASAGRVVDTILSAEIQAGRAVLVATHDVRESNSSARILVLEGGRIEKEGQPG